MIGNNTMELNEATMVEIVQYWLTNKFLNRDELSPKVTSVRPCMGMGVAYKIELSQNQQ